MTWGYMVAVDPILFLWQQSPCHRQLSGWVRGCDILGVAAGRGVHCAAERVAMQNDTLTKKRQDFQQQKPDMSNVSNRTVAQQKRCAQTEDQPPVFLSKRSGVRQVLRIGRRLDLPLCACQHPRPTDAASYCTCKIFSPSSIKTLKTEALLPHVVNQNDRSLCLIWTTFLLRQTVAPFTKQLLGTNAGRNQT